MAMLNRFDDVGQVADTIRQKSDDLEFVEISTSGFAVEIEPDNYVYHHDMVMRVVFCNDKSWFIHRDAAELLLNDGILSRMNVKIKLANWGEDGKPIE